MTLGERVRQTRLARGMTQRTLAGAHITRNQLSLIENDQTQPSLRTLEFLAEQLGVEPGWLLTGTESDASGDGTAQAWLLLRDGQYAACLETLSPASGDEAALLRAVCTWRLAEQALLDEQFSQAQELAGQALEQNRSGLYENAALEISCAGILARCAQAQKSGAEEAFETYRKTYLRLRMDVAYHLTLARYDLEQEHIQAAEREIWSISDLPEEDRAEYLILRGRIAAKKEQYENAILYLRQAEEIESLPRLLRRELLMGLERCYKETQQYKLAYEAAAAQREL